LGKNIDNSIENEEFKITTREINTENTGLVFTIIEILNKIVFF